MTHCSRIAIVYFRRSMHIGLVAGMLLGAGPLYGQMTITANTTQNGGILTVIPAGTLTVSHATNHPRLTLSGGATTSGVQSVVIGDLNAQVGFLQVWGSTLSNGGGGYLGLNAGSAGVATVSGQDALWQNASFLSVGNSGTATLSVENGGTVTNSVGYLGYNSTGVGNATVDASLWQNSSSLVIGWYGTGHLYIIDGGAVTNTDGYLGYHAGSNGTALVTGAGSHWQNSSSVIVGKAGTGTLDITNGGLVTSTGGTLGSSEVVDTPSGELSYRGSGTVTVTGAGSQWQNSSSVIVGRSGTGTLNIENGGLVTSTVGVLGWHELGLIFGYEFPIFGSGTVTVTGAGSQWQNSSSVYVGYTGTGTLNIENGGQVNGTNGWIGYGDDSLGATTIKGAGSTWQNSGSFVVGNLGTGTLSIMSQGLLTNTTGWIGDGSGSTGTATVTGDGSMWQNSSTFVVGNLGTGALSIISQGLLTNTSGFIGYGSGSTGTATVTGDGSTWQNSGGLFVGGSSFAAGGTGNVQILDQGLVSVGGNTKLWGGGTVTVNGGTLSTGSIDRTLGTFNHYNGTLKINSGTYSQANGALLVSGNTSTAVARLELLGGATAATGVQAVIVGNLANRRGELLVSGGSTLTNSGTGTLGTFGSVSVTSGFGYLGLNSGATGVATITGASSTWTNSGDLYVGQFGNGTLTVEAGGLVTSSQGFLGVVAGSNGTATVTDANSQWQNSGNLYVGGNAGAAGGTGRLEVLNGGLVDSTGLLHVHSTGTLSIDNSRVNVGSLAGSGAVTTAGGAILRTGGDNTSTTFSGQITGNGSFEKTGSGTQTLSGVSTYTGGTFVDAGMLTASAGSLGQTREVRVASGATLSLLGAHNLGPASLYLGNGGTGVAALTGNSVVIQGPTFLNGDAELTVGASVFHQQISGAGKLIIDSSSFDALGGIDVTQLYLGGLVRTSSVGNSDVHVSGTLEFLNSTAAVEKLSGDGLVRFSNALRVGSGNGSSQYEGLFDGPKLIKAGAGTFTIATPWYLTGSNSPLPLEMDIEAGTVAVVLPAVKLNQGLIRVSNGGTLSLDVFSVGSGVNLYLNGSGASGVGAFIVPTGSGYEWQGQMIVESNSTIRLDDYLAISGQVSGPGILTKTGAGLLTLGNPNGLLTDLVLSEGTAQVTQSGGSSLRTITVENEASLHANGSTGSHSFALQLHGLGDGAGALRVTGSHTWQGAIQVNDSSIGVDLGGSLTVNGPISGSGDLVKVGGGTLVLEGAGSFTGDAVVTAGVLDVRNPNVLAGSSAVDVRAGAALLLANNSVIAGPQLRLTGAGTGAGALVIAGGSNSWSGPTMLSGSTTIGIDSGTLTLGSLSEISPASLTKVGSGELILGSTTLSGILDVASGKLQFTDTAVDLGGLRISHLGTVEFAANTQVSQGGAGLEFYRTGFAPQRGTARFLGGMSSYLSPVTIGPTGANLIVDSGELTLGEIRSIFTNIFLTKQGEGVLVLTDGKHYGTTVQAGSLRLQGGHAVNDAGEIVVSEGASLEVRNAEVMGKLTTYPNITLTLQESLSISGGTIIGNLSISGPGELIKYGPGNLALSGHGTVTGGLRVDGGSLSVNLVQRSFTGDLNLAANTSLTVTKGSISAPRILGGGSILLSQGSSLNATVLSSGSIQLTQGSSLNANVLSGGSILLSQGSSLNATVLSTASLSVDRSELFIAAGQSANLGYLSVYGDSDGNLGALTISGGEIHVGQLELDPYYGQFTMTGGTLVAGTITTTQGDWYGPLDSPFEWTGGTIEAYQIGFDLVQQGGTLAPGNSPGELVIFGDYTMGSLASLDIEIGGSERGVDYDVLTVMGHAELNGTLNIRFINGYMGNGEFDIFQFGSVSGAFSSIHVLGLPDWMQVDTTRLLESGSFSAVPEPSTWGLISFAGIMALGLRKMRKRRMARAVSGKCRHRVS